MSKKLVIATISFSLIVLFGLFANLNNTLFGEKILAAKEDNVPDVEGVNNSQSGENPNNLPQTEKLSDSIDDNIEEEFRIVISSVGISKDVVRNVSPSNSEEYLSVLNHSVAHGKYTLLPNEAIDSGNVYLFAHRQGSYNGKDIGFFKKLNEVQPGEEAYIYFDGHTYIYKFRSSVIISPKDTYVYTAYSPTPTLTLQTCEDGYSKRLILTFDLIGWY